MSRLPSLLSATAALLLVGLGAPFANADAQQRLVGGTAISGGPVLQTWSFGAPVPLDTVHVRSATQLVVPVQVQTTFRTGWTASVTGALARGAIETTAADGTGATGTRRLDGLSDLRVRVTGPLRGDGLLLSLGLNLPTGAVGLDGQQTEALRVLGAPALDARSPVLGVGFGATAGLVAARQLGPWAWAAGAAFERRGSYSPIEATIAGGGSRSTQLDPGDVVHLSLGGDGLVGQHRMGVNLVVDLYGQDAVSIPVSTGELARERYQLGPTIGAAWQWQVAGTPFRDLVITASDRYRTAFTGPDGDTVEGSSGNYLDLGASGLLGAPGRRALALGVELRQHTGLSADRGFIGAGLTAVGATAGLVLPTARAEWRPWVRATTGQLRTATLSTTMTGLSVGLSLVVQ